MTHKQQCVANCKEFLQQRNLLEIFSQSEFESYYRKHHCSEGNALTIGMKIADYLIHTVKPFAI